MTDIDNSELKCCPFCGHNPDKLDFIVTQGSKWGNACCPNCGAMGPEVRTGYDTSDNAEWHEDAEEEWNTRISDIHDTKETR